MRGGFRVVAVDSVTSTQDLLAARARAGEDVAGECVRASAQTRGRGRRGTEWTSAVGGSYQSVGLGRETYPWLTLALGVGVAQALGELSGSPVVTVKWPNDLYLEGGKLGGILAEVVSGQVIVGVGVNVANEVGQGASRLRGQSLEEVGDAVLAGLASGLELARSGGDAVAESFSRCDHLAGRLVEVALGEPGADAGSVSGVARGVDPRGALLLEDRETGERVSLTAGHVVRFSAGR